jgi:thiamine transport system ATP-binding protein
MTIHTPEDVADFADQMAFVSRGEVAASGTPGDILDGPLAAKASASTSDS